MSTSEFPNDYEIRSADESPVITGSTLVGYAAVFNTLSRDLGGFREVIRPGAFARHLSGKPDVRALIEHDPNKLLGRTSSGSVRLIEDSRGLRYEVDLPDTTYANDLRALMQRGDVTKSSFGFRVAKEGQQFRKEGDQVIRELHHVDVFDVSPLTSVPAYDATSVALRSFKEWGEPQTPPAPADVSSYIEEKRNWVRQWESEM